MHPQEWWWVAESKRPPKMFGSLTEAEVEELDRFAFGAEEDDD